MPDSSHVPLHAYEVLEDEYRRLHGELTPEEQVELRGRGLISAPLNHRFHKGHVKNGARLAERLGRGDEIGAHLEAVAPGLRQHLADYARTRDDAHLERALNELLTVELYQKEAFRNIELKRSTVKLAEVYANSQSPSAEALADLNRILLEETFPEEIETLSDIRLAAMYKRLHALKTKQAALCFSGGGIRSGTFALGILQGLARCNLLREFDYLSTVSGGGYIGSWLTAWLHRHPEGLRGVTRDLRNTAPATKVDPDPKPIQYLRQYSSFLTPQVGILTADTWTFIGIYFRNLLLNWLVFIPLLLAVLMIPRLMLTITLNQPIDAAQPVNIARVKDAEQLRAIPERERVSYPAEPLPLVGEKFFDVPFVETWFEDEEQGDTNLYLRHLLFLAGLVLGVWALAYIAFNRPGLRGQLGNNSQFWYRRANQRGFLLYCLVPLLSSAFLLTTYWAWSQETVTVSKTPWRFLGFGLGFTACGGLIASYVLGRRLFGNATRGAPDDRVRWTEAAAIAGAGVVAGGLFWIITLFPFGDNPAVGYGQVVRDGQLVSSPLPWTDWTKWSWADWTTELYVCFGVPIFLLVFWAATTFFVGVSSNIGRIGDEDREWWARFGAWLLIAGLAWSVLSLLVIFGPLALLELPHIIGAVGGLSGLIAILVGRSATTPARDKAQDAKAQGKVGLLSRLLSSSLPLLGVLFLATFVAAVSLLATGITRQLAVWADDYRDSRETPPAPGDPRDFEWLTNVPEGTPWRGFEDYRDFIEPVVPTLEKPAPTPRPPVAGATPCTPLCSGVSSDDDDEKEDDDKADEFVGAQIVHMNVLHHTSIWFTLLLAGLMFGLGALLSRLVNLNYFSIHGGYRNRLIRAFLGASRPPGQRRPNPFTGFDPLDNIPMHELRYALFDEDDFLMPDKLAAQLFDTTNPLSQYLVEQKLIDRVKDDDEQSPELPGVLRTCLNDVVERLTLYRLPFASQYLDSSHQVLQDIKNEMASKREGMAEDALPRIDYHVLLNRMMLEAAYPGMINPYPPPPYKLMHVVNTTLNLVGGDNLAWQQRKAEPFSFSPLHAGCFRVGYRDARDYGGKRTGGISIGTAAAISGAAASSNMGYYNTSPVISILLTLFNVRLGWWLGNPGPAGADTYERSAPKYAALPVIQEAFGLTDDRNEYVYLTDGGHFENLAVYEMVFRRCHFIVVVDGGEDADYRFTDLGNAVRKIRIDLGVSIDFPCVDIYSYEQMLGEKKERPGMYWAVGRIRYSCVDGDDAPDGVMLYIKPAVYGNEPRDVLEYKKSFPAFPHQSTGDQFFDEPQFESYRELGSHIMDQLCGTNARDPQAKPVKLSLADVMARAARRVQETCAKDLQDEHGHQALRSRDGKTYLDWLGERAAQSGAGAQKQEQDTQKQQDIKEDDAAAPDAGRL